MERETQLDFAREWRSYILIFLFILRLGGADSFEGRDCRRAISFTEDTTICYSPVEVEIECRRVSGGSDGFSHSRTDFLVSGARVSQRTERALVALSECDAILGYYIRLSSLLLLSRRYV
jgi:hypothetical protein